MYYTEFIQPGLYLRIEYYTYIIAYILQTFMHLRKMPSHLNITLKAVSLSAKKYNVKFESI